MRILRKILDMLPDPALSKIFAPLPAPKIPPLPDSPQPLAKPTLGQTIMNALIHLSYAVDVCGPRHPKVTITIEGGDREAFAKAVEDHMNRAFEAISFPGVETHRAKFEDRLMGIDFVWKDSPCSSTAAS